MGLDPADQEGSRLEVVWRRERGRGVSQIDVEALEVDCSGEGDWIVDVVSWRASAGQARLRSRAGANGAEVVRRIRAIGEPGTV